MSVLEFLKNDRNIIIYRPELNEITGSVTATILLQQIIYRWDGNPFYKFKSKCKHELYKSGDSWTEELGFSEHEFDTALSKISTKVNRNSDLSKITTPVYHWISIDRVTYYAINTPVLTKKLNEIYDLRKPSLSGYENQESDASINQESPVIKTDNPGLDIRITKNTTENTENKKINKKDSEDVLLVFNHWQTVMSKNKALLDDKRSKIINRALKAYSIDDLKHAIDGCAKSDFHMGKNPTGTKYNELSNIFGDSEKTDRFIELSGTKRPSNNPHDLREQDYENAQDYFEVPVNQECQW